MHRKMQTPNFTFIGHVFWLGGLLSGLTFGRVGHTFVHVEPVVLLAAPNGMVTGNCEDWADACDLNYALSITAQYDTEIWVKEGRYLPTIALDRHATFQLTNGLHLYGGFSGTETSREQRDWLVYPTILSGDLGIEGDPTDNAYHVVLSIGVDQTTVIDGFTITAGNADDDVVDSNGGGLYIENSTLSLSNLVFLENNAAYSGGGIEAKTSYLALKNVAFTGNTAVFGSAMDCDDSSLSIQETSFNANVATNQGGGIYAVSSDLVMTDVSFTGNTASYGGGGIELERGNQSLLNATFTGNTVLNGVGGGIVCDYCNLTLTNSTFEENSAESGGGIFTWSSDPVLTHVSFINNIAGYSGGGMRNDDFSNPRLIDVSFTGNQADFYGGGMYNEDHSNPALLDVSFTKNQAEYGGGLYADNADSLTMVDAIFSGNISGSYGGGIYFEGSDPVLANVIFSGNMGGILGGGIFNHYSNSRLVNVTFTGNTAGTGGAMGNDYSNPYIANSIFWYNAASMGSQIYDRFESASQVVFSLVQDGYPGTRILTEDPCFVDADGPDGIFGTPDDNLHLLGTSPGIDAGDNLSLPTDLFDLDSDGDVGEQLPFDLDGLRRRIDVITTADTGNGNPPIVDLGAYEILLVRNKVFLPLINR